MGTITGLEKATILFENFSEESRNLFETFRNIDADFQAVSMEDDGFLPDGVISPYTFFLGDFSTSKDVPGKPLFFNQIQIPEYWRISGTNSFAKVTDQATEKARIFYAEPKNKRLVKVVDWLDENGVVRQSEHYNKFGAIFCRTNFNKKGQKVSRDFYAPDGSGMIYENFVTGDILVRWNGKDKIVHNKTELTQYFLKCSGLENTNIYFNSLSYPYFVTLGLPPATNGDALFWNEPIANSIPGNMNNILNRTARRCKRIYVQRHDAYKRMVELGVDTSIVKELGYVYSFKRENLHRMNALICTNSDRVEYLEEFAKENPSIHFHVCALTEMSNKLTDLDRYENISLYPGIKGSVADELFNECDIYMDINHESEILDAVHRAFMNNMLILGFKETIHNPKYHADTNIFALEEHHNFAKVLQLISENPVIIDEALIAQKKAACAAAPEDYQILVDKQ